MSNNLLVVPVSPKLCIRVQGGNHQRKITFEPRLNHKPMGGGFRRKACGQVGCVVEEAVCGGRRLERRRQSSRAKDLASVEDAVITNRIDRQLINSSFGAAIVQCLCCYALVLFPRKNGASECKEKSSWISIWNKRLRETRRTHSSSHDSRRLRLSSVANSFHVLLNSGYMIACHEFYSLMPTLIPDKAHYLIELQPSILNLRNAVDMSTKGRL